MEPALGWVLGTERLPDAGKYGSAGMRTGGERAVAFEAVAAEAVHPEHAAEDEQQPAEPDPPQLAGSVAHRCSDRGRA